MKTRLTLFALITTLAFFSWAQNKPKEGAVIRMDSYELTVAQGQTVEATIQLIRASRFEKAEIDGLTVQSKDGLIAEVKADANLQDVFTLSLRALTIDAGTYPLIVRAEGKMAHKVKQAMFMLTVEESTVLAAKGQ